MLKHLTQLADDHTAVLADMFKLLGDPSRLKIVIALLDGPLSVGSIAERLSLSPSLVSHHLRLLRAARIASHERRGRQMLYSVHDHHIRCVIEDMVEHVTEGAD
ncbi:regulatory protein ArsR [Tepidicaulis marinus]|uniref:Regulatory protein ArsR n=1 Tax=Tepidicaulis marinus TaxID=1333998 RepID=A0A081B9V9_9HYPH|nr:metalloregulator ArsR/SmtB family transcription factor [Tepidicaulis marinus]GAK44827.1 regulatory protein ArsR [Tepidicaulis marinus]